MQPYELRRPHKHTESKACMRVTPCHTHRELASFQNTPRANFAVADAASGQAEAAPVVTPTHTGLGRNESKSPGQTTPR